MISGSYTYFMPTKVECGFGLTKKLGEKLLSYQAEQVMIVTDGGVREAGLLDGIEESLKKTGISFSIYDQVEPNPSAETIDKGIQFLTNHQAELVLAIGGGSSIDTAKGVAIMATNSGQILDYEGVDQVPHPGLPLVAIPTTAGTGSEVTASTIITNQETKFKTAVISPYLFPRLALLDPELTVSLPAAITAATGMDALTHAIESYLSKNSTPVSEALALQAMRLIGQAITDSYFVGTNPWSREQMLVASMLAGAAFAQSRLGNVHAISHTLGGIFQIAHGVANACLLPYVMKFNAPACPAKMRDIALALGEDLSGLTQAEAADQAVKRVIQLNQELGIPHTIQELGVNLDALPKMVEDSMRSGNVHVNPRLTKAEDIQGIIEAAYYGRL